MSMLAGLSACQDTAKALCIRLGLLEFFLLKPHVVLLRRLHARSAVAVDGGVIVMILFAAALLCCFQLPQLLLVLQTTGDSRNSSCVLGCCHSAYNGSIVARHVCRAALTDAAMMKYVQGHALAHHIIAAAISSGEH
jgi:hypothetical protein